MADVTITGLPNASALTGAERVPMDQGGTTVDAAAGAIAALATKSTVGLSNVDNTSDANKPVSTAQQTALDAKATAGAIGSSGLTMTAGVLGRESGTGAPVVLTLSGLSIVNGVLAVTAGGSGTVTSVGLSMPTGFSVGNSPITTTGTLAVTFAAGYSIPLTASQASWDAAAALATTAVQPAGLTSYVQTSDARLSDSREWSAATVSQAQAEAGTSTSRLAFTPLRVFQSVAAYVAANFSAVGQALATAANAGAARTTLGLGTAATAATGDFAAASHNQAASTISDSTAAGRALLTAADAAAQRTSLGLGNLATQSGTFSGTSSGTNTGDQDLSTLLAKASNLSDLASAATARTNLGAAASGAITSSGLTMNTNRILLRSTAGTGPVEEGTTSGGLVLVNGVLVPGEIVKLIVSNVGETGITTGNFKSETRIDRAFVVVGVSWNCHPTAMGSASTSDARPYIRTGAGTTSAGTKTNLLTTTNNIASLAASIHTVDATSSISGGTYSGSAGDWLGVDLMSLGTGSSGHQLTLILRYS